MRKHLVFLLLAVGLAGITSGCIFSPDKGKKEPPPPLPPNDTPEHTILRFVGAYEQMKAVEYEGLFTRDFTYDFSNATDPDLVQKYSTGWFKQDEKASSRNLFQGGTNSAGEYQPKATSIDINLAVTAPVQDPGSSDPERHYTLLTRIDGTIVVPTSPDPTTYIIENNLNRFFLVRGDAAVDLDTGQPADANHWYIYNWRDETQQPVAPNRVEAASSSSTPSHLPLTLGRVKAESR